MKVLIIKVNQLGDNVVFLPVVEQLVRDLGVEAIHIFTSPVASALYHGVIHDEQVHTFETRMFNTAWKHPLKFFRLLTLVRQIAPDTVLLAEDQGNVAHLLSLLSGARLRIGVKRSFIKVPWGVNRSIDIHENEAHAISSWKLLGEYYSSIGKKNAFPAIPPRPGLSTGFNLEKKYDFVVHAGASRDYQKWGVERHAELANRLAEEHRVAWVATDKISPSMLTRAVDRCETPTLRDLMTLMMSSRIFIGNNSGPMNLAVALGIPGLIVCGPSRFEWDPYWSSENYLLLRAPGLSCLPCDTPNRPMGVCTNRENPMACMNFWTVDQVYEEALRWLQSKGETANPKEFGDEDLSLVHKTPTSESPAPLEAKHTHDMLPDRLVSRNQEIQVLGSSMFVTDYQRLSSLLMDIVTGRGSPCAIDFANTQIVTMRRHDLEFATLSVCMDITVPDGMPLVWVMNRKGAALKDRVYGPTFTRKFLASCPQGKTHYLVGGSEECGRKFRERMTVLNPSLTFIGGYHGPCTADGVLQDDEAVLAEILEKKPDFIWVGLGTPKQYAWINRIKPLLEQGVLLAVGFAFDVNAGMKSDAPMWMQRFGLTWVYRMVTEPRRLAGRYLKWNTLFVLYSGLGAVTPFLCRAKRFLRDLGLRAVDLIASDIRDCVTGENLGPGLILGWRGHPWVIGHAGLPPLIPRFLPQRRLTYWKQAIGFTTYARPDYPRLTVKPEVSESPRVINVVLTHLGGGALQRLLEAWKPVCSREDLWIAFGGSRHDFDAVDYPRKVYVQEKALRHKDNQRGKQSYTGIFQAMEAVVKKENPDFIYFCEFDHLPLVQDLNARQVTEIKGEKADVMGHWLYRVDGTNNHHLLYHESDPHFFPYWTSISSREDPGIILSMFGSGSFWSREAFLAVASREQGIPCYLELYLPTLAHHLGFRVRGWNESNHLISNLPSRSISKEEGVKRGSWTVHPVKEEVKKSK